jgi:aminoglycoside phosphotransferase (APT) family kinase protein
MATTLHEVHASAVEAPPHHFDLHPENLTVPAWSKRPADWTTALSLLEDPPPIADSRFIHGDYQHFNLLWSRNRLTGVIDWVSADTGPREVDVGHCRLNLAVLFSVDMANQFGALYSAAAGVPLDPRWEVIALLRYLPGWGSFIQVQAGRQAIVDRAGMHHRVDTLLSQAVQRL